MAGSGTGTPATAASSSSLLSMTVMDIIEASLRAIHVISPNESLSAGRAKSARQNLNTMLGLWSTKGLVVPFTTRESFTLTPGSASYTWGTGGTFNSERPLSVMDGVFLTKGGYDYPINLIGEDEYNSISVKTTSGQPEQLFYKSDFDKATVYLYPAPDTADVLTVTSRKPFTSYTALTTTISLPPEYFAAIKWNLALESCPDYEKEPSQTIVVMAERSLDSIMALNAANRLEPIKLNLGLESGIQAERGRSTGWDIQ